jgi:hypothetical protein
MLSFLCLLMLTLLVIFYRQTPTVFEVMSDLWNSEEFNPMAPASECHVDNISAVGLIARVHITS